MPNEFGHLKVKDISATNVTFSGDTSCNVIYGNTITAFAGGVSVKGGNFDCDGEGNFGGRVDISSAGIKSLDASTTLGLYSMAFGNHNTIASGDFAFAFGGGAPGVPGSLCEATGDYSIAMGFNAEALSPYAIALGSTAHANSAKINSNWW